MRLIIIGLFLSGFAHGLSRAADDNLTSAFAKHRKYQIQAVDYELFLKFEKSTNEYSGRTIIHAKLNQTNEPLSLDFVGKKVSEVKVNGTVISDFITRTGSLEIPAKRLKPTTQIEISYLNEFSKDTDGVRHTLDPEDGSEYISTDFEPYRAHSLFPCFDQPDLKASYTISVDAPKEWSAIGNEEIAQSKTEGDRTTTIFKKTRPFSTYLVFVGVGPWTKWTDSADKIPMELYARKSMAKFVDATTIFATARKGLKFYADYFGHPYPFSKFGQVLVPDMFGSAMENPGAITYGEDAIFRGTVSQSQIENRDNLILHEMAHMWFGNLVTMTWWNDLWLNESFASYMAMLAQERALNQKGARIAENNSKDWGYWQDQLVTTHPIETEVLDTRSGRGNFDGITYAKGSAVLQQLHQFAGEDAFKKGLGAYFIKFAFQNAGRADFIDAIARASNKDLGPWTKAWLQSAGPHRVQSIWNCENGKINSFVIEQSKNTSGLYSPHQTQIAFYQGSDFKLLKTLSVTYDGAKTNVSEAIGLPCPIFVNSNHGDTDYALFSLDSVSLQAARAVLIGGIKDPLTRVLIWENLGQMVRDAKLSLTDYTDYFLAGISAESDPILLGALLGPYSTFGSYYSTYMTKTQRQTLAPKLEQTLWQRLVKEPARSSAQVTFFDFYVRVAQSEASQERLLDFLKGEQLPKGLELDQLRRWKIIITLATNGYPGARDLIAKEQKNDSSSDGQQFAYAAQIALPDVTSKKKFWQDLKKLKIAFPILQVAAGKFNDSNHPELSENFVSSYFESLQKIDWAANDSMVNLYFDHLFPQNLCSEKLLNESLTKLRQTKNLVPLAKRAWLESNDQLSRCISVRAFDKKKAI